MGNYINENLLDASPMKKQKDEAKKLVSKWEKTGLLEGLNEDFQRSGMAVMLENQARQLISEASKTNPTTAKDEEWSGVALPLVRRIFGEIAAQEFVSVQPMNLPSGLVFYLDFKYGTAIGGRETTESLAGTTGPNSPSGSSAPYGVGGLYGAGQFGYSMTGSIVSGATANDNDVDILTTASFADINYDSQISASSAGKLFKVKICFLSASAAAGNKQLSDTVDKTAIRAFQYSPGIAASGIGETEQDGGGTIQVLQQFTKLNAAGDIEFIVSASTAAAAAARTVSPVVLMYSAPTEADRGDFEDRAGNATTDSLGIPEVNMQLNSLPIVAKTRKLKAVWTPELAQDLNAYHSVDAEAELTSMLSEYISMEIDLEILDMLINDAVTVDYWSAKQGNDFDAGSSSFKNTTFYGTRFEWYQTLVAKIQKVSNEIHRLTLRGGANFVVCGPKVATVLESLPGYNKQPSDNAASKFAMGVSSIGAVDGRFNVYKNPYMTENTILVGFRGANFLETGAVYAPYVPLIMTPLVYDPSDFTPRKGVMTRYAKKMIRPEFYGKIYAADLNLI